MVRPPGMAGLPQRLISKVRVHACARRGTRTHARGVVARAVALAAVAAACAAA